MSYDLNLDHIEQQIRYIYDDAYRSKDNVKDFSFQSSGK